MVPESAGLTISTGLRRSEKESAPVYYRDVRFEAESGVRRVDLLIKPVPMRSGGNSETLIIFFESPRDKTAARAEELTTPSDVQRLTELEDELKFTRENLQTTVEELQTSNEELQATNEELMSSNEELQSTNEELQSVNEELQTVNTEYQERIDELAQLNADIDNLLKSTNVGTLFLDRNLRPRRYTPAARSEFNLLPASIDHPLAEIEHSFEAADFKELLDRAREVGRAGNPFEREIETRFGRWYLVRLLPFLDPDRRVDGVVLALLDIDARKKASEEKIEMERRLRETQKLESLGVLASGIAHDFNNLLTGISGNVGLARLNLDDDSPALEQLVQAEKSSLRAADLCRQLLAYAGAAPTRFKTMDVSKLVNDSLGLIRVSLAKNADIRLNLGDSLPHVSGDVAQLQQVAINLVLNASEALEEKPGTIQINTYSRRIETGDLNSLRIRPDNVPGTFVALEVRDNGCGMDEATLARVFDPFFTTKFIGRGLGLSATLGILRTHEAGIEVASEAGAGTCFTVLLPAVEHAHADNDQPGPPPQVGDWRGEGTILFVDDEADVREVGKGILASLGFDVILAADGLQGLERFTAQRSRIRGVMLDLTMPGMTGDQLHAEIRRQAPDLPILMMSGFDADYVMARLKTVGVAEYIQKPFEVDRLRARLKESFHTREIP